MLASIDTIDDVKNPESLEEVSGAHASAHAMYLRIMQCYVALSNYYVNTRCVHGSCLDRPHTNRIDRVTVAIDRLGQVMVRLHGMSVSISKRHSQNSQASKLSQKIANTIDVLKDGKAAIKKSATATETIELIERQSQALRSAHPEKYIPKSEVESIEAFAYGVNRTYDQYIAHLISRGVDVSALHDRPNLLYQLKKVYVLNPELYTSMHQEFMSMMKSTLRTKPLARETMVLWSVVSSLQGLSDNMKRTLRRAGTEVFSQFLALMTLGMESENLTLQEKNFHTKHLMKFIHDIYTDHDTIIDVVYQYIENLFRLDPPSTIMNLSTTVIDHLLEYARFMCKRAGAWMDTKTKEYSKSCMSYIKRAKIDKDTILLIIITGLDRIERQIIMSKANILSAFITNPPTLVLETHVRLMGTQDQLKSIMRSTSAIAVFATDKRVDDGVTIYTSGVGDMVLADQTFSCAIADMMRALIMNKYY